MKPFIIDAHMHLGAPGTLYTRRSEPGDILKLMDKLGIERAYSTHHWWLFGDIKKARDESMTAYEKSGGRIPFLGAYNPNYPEKSLKLFDECLGYKGFIGIKLHPSIHGVPADDLLYKPVWEYSSKHKLPIMSHTWSVTYNPVQKLSQPALFEDYISSNPDVIFISGHCGGPGNGQAQAIRLAQKYPNAYVDISGDIFMYNLIPNLVKEVGADKILFGSDQPWVDPRSHILRTYLADITIEEKELILRQNALRIFEPDLK